MTVLFPCHRCARKGDCEKRAGLREKLRGAAVTKANVKCAIPKADFPIGAPVAVRTFTIEDERKTGISCRGVVMRHRAGRFLILLNVGEEVGLEDRPISIIGAHHDQLSLVEGQEAPVELCECGLTDDRCKDKALRPQFRNGPWSCRQDFF
jgi:hypothetical protein